MYAGDMPIEFAIVFFIGLMIGLAVLKVRDYLALKKEAQKSYLAEDSVENYPEYPRHGDTPLFDQMAYESLGSENYEAVSGDAK